VFDIYNIIKYYNIYSPLANIVYNRLLGYILTGWYVSEVVSRPKALADMTVDDFFDLVEEGIVLMSEFKTQAAFLVQPIVAGDWILR
jgi:hypothetical protein